jgi:nucleotide-binding universal stress UspA family protein
VLGLASETLPGLGRVADVLVVARPEDDSAGIHVGLIEAALFESGRPVLLAPRKMPASLGRNIAVAWNGTPEAAHALGAAMPLLMQADVVSILSHHPGSNGHVGGTDETDVQGLLAYLGWHGIAARVASPPAGGQHVGEALVAGAVAASADLLVMGAYGHSRLREMVFGGATRHVVDDGTLPTLLMH